MNADDLQFLRDLVEKAAVASWTVKPTPAELDLASHSPSDRPTATLYAGDRPVATFWSYMHNGPANAAVVEWMARNLPSMLDGTLSRQSVEDGLSKLAGLAYRGWWPGSTPFYLRGNDPHAVTMRTNQHTEEIATLWGEKAEDTAHVLAFLVNGGPDLLVRSLGDEGLRVAVETMAPIIAQPFSPGRGQRSVTIGQSAIDAAVRIGEANTSGRIPVSNAVALLESLVSERFYERLTGPEQIVLQAGDVDAWYERLNQTDQPAP